MPAALAAAPVSGLTLTGAIASAVSSAGIWPRATPVRNPLLPPLTLATALSTSPEEGQRGAVTESEELTLDLRPGATAAALGSARARIAQSAASVRMSLRGLVADVITAFFAVARDRADADAARGTLDLAQRSFDAASRRHHAGVAPAIDVERATIALDRARADANAANAALEGDSAALLRLTGGNSAEVDLVLPAPAVLPNADVFARDVLATNPDISTAFAAVDASRAQAQLARADLRPALSLGAGVGRSILRDAQVVGPAANVSLGIPFAGGAARASAASADAALAAARVQLRQAQIDAVQNALSDLTAAERERSRIDALQDAYTRAQRVAEAELQGYAIGAVSSTDVVTAQGQAAAAGSALAQARVAAARADAMVQLDMGSFDR